MTDPLDNVHPSSRLLFERIGKQLTQADVPNNVV